MFLITAEKFPKHRKFYIAVGANTWLPTLLCKDLVHVSSLQSTYWRTIFHSRTQGHSVKWHGG